jgi:methionine-rich copper-binding protein CopC
MIISMTPSETAIAQVLAVMRNTNARHNNVTDKQVSKQSPIEIDRDGVLSEMAFGKAFNLYPDLAVKSTRSGVDLVGKNGNRIDVKSTRYKAGRLIIHIDKPLDEVDIYALAIVDGDNVDLVGYIKATDAMKKENIKDLGYGDVYVIEQDALIKFKDAP